MKTGAPIDLVVLGVYFVILIGIGIYFSRKNKGGKDYFSGGNRLPWWVSGISLYMASFSAWTFTGAAGFVYSTEWFGVIYFIIWPVAFLAGSQITAAKWRRTRVISPVEYTRTRYNTMTQQTIGFVVVINALFGLGLTLTAVSQVIGSIMGLNITMVIIVSSLAILFYTYFGGLWAVAIADVFQFVILIGITIVILPLSLNLVGGIGNVFSHFTTLSMDHTFKGEVYNIFWLIAIFVFNTFNAANQAQRYYSVRDEKAAKKVGLLCGSLFITIPILFGIPPLVAKMLWPDLMAVEFFKSQTVPMEYVFIALVLKILPNGLIGVFMAAMFSATLSALDSAYNSAAAVMARDIYGGLFKPNASDHQLMVFGKIATFCIGIVTTITAIIYSSSNFGIFNWMMVFVSLFNIPMAIPLVCGLIFKDLRRWSGLATILFGLLLGVVEKFFLGWPFGFQMLGTVFFCLLAILSSNVQARLYIKNKVHTYLLGAFVTVFFILWFELLAQRPFQVLDHALVIIIAGIIGTAVIFFSGLYAKETPEDKEIINKFFQKLHTPISKEELAIIDGK
jgi:solute:Na+ symporter, SSS family